MGLKRDGPLYSRGMFFGLGLPHRGDGAVFPAWNGLRGRPSRAPGADGAGAPQARAVEKNRHRPRRHGDLGDPRCGHARSPGATQPVTAATRAQGRDAR